MGTDANIDHKSAERAPNNQHTIMASKEISPVTVAALRYLCTHGTATMADLRASVPDLKAKTMSNLIDMTMVVSAGHACYTITTK